MNSTVSRFHCEKEKLNGQCSKLSECTETELIAFNEDVHRVGQFTDEERDLQS
jgi:hypothetical protein